MKKNIFILMAIVLTIAACKKGDLDRFPQTSIPAELFFNTESDLTLYTNGLLSLPDRTTYLSDQSSDNASTTGAVEVKNVMAGNATASNITSGWDWERLRNINYFLDNYQKAAVSQDIKNHYAGIARYYRAQFYFDKVKRFSDVPWHSHTLNPGDAELYKARDSRALVMDSVMADLDFAFKNVKESVPVGTPGKWSVGTLYARIALYEGTYRKYHDELNLTNTANTFLETSAKVAGEIMASGKFSIYKSDIPKPEEDYATLFSSQDLSANKEIILSNVFDMSKDKSQNVNSVVFGQYEQAPARDLLQSYLMKDGSRFTAQANYEKFDFVSEFKDRDPRLAQTFAYPGWVRAPESSPYIQQLNKNFTGYHQLKGYVNSVDNAILNSVDFPVYRYAEVLLTYAESLAELGTLTQGNLDQSVNLVRQRVGLPNLNLGQANADVDPLLRQQYPNVTANTGVILEIRRERRVEFAFEGIRYDDLMRWKAGKLLTKNPEGMYFAGLGKYDLTGDGVPDIVLIDASATIPAEGQKEKNSLGVTYVYYRTGTIGSDATVYLKNGKDGGALVTDASIRKFEEPKYYYRPIPQQQVLLNPALKQIFGW